jgi:hypothetical protein
VSDIDAIIGWLLEAPRGRQLVEDCGATMLLSAISGTKITAVVHSHGSRELTAGEQQQLQVPGAAAGYQRHGTLYAGSVPAAAVTALLLPCRIPDRALHVLGNDSDGTTLSGGGVPLGRALAGYGVRREPLEVLATPGQLDAAGQEQVVWSAARLWLDTPIALVTECFFKKFLDAFPGPWALPRPGPRTAT